MIPEIIVLLPLAPFIWAVSLWALMYQRPRPRWTPPVVDPPRPTQVVRGPSDPMQAQEILTSIYAARGSSSPAQGNMPIDPEGVPTQSLVSALAQGAVSAEQANVLYLDAQWQLAVERKRNADLSRPIQRAARRSRAVH